MARAKCGKEKAGHEKKEVKKMVKEFEKKDKKADKKLIRGMMKKK